MTRPLKISGVAIAVLALISLITHLKACELSHWKDWRIIDTLAAAYAEQGDFEQAIKYQKRVLGTGGSSKDDKIKNHLTFYEQHVPYRELAK